MVEEQQLEDAAASLVILERYDIVDIKEYVSILLETGIKGLTLVV